MEKVLEFLEFVFLNIIIIIPLFAIIVYAYYKILKKFIYGWLDPLFLGVIFLSASTLDVIILFLNKTISIYYLSSYLFTEVAMILGISLFYYKNINEEKFIRRNRVNEIMFLIFYYIYSIIFVLSQIIAFRIVGFGLFSKGSRLDLYAGIGQLNRLIDATTLVVIILIFLKFFYYKKRNIVDYIILVTILIIMILSGSKSAFIILFQTLFIVSHTINKIEPNIKIKKFLLKTKRYIPVIALILIFIYYIISIDKSVIGIITSLTSRIFKSGDIFILGYDDSVIDSLIKADPITYLFGGNNSVLNKIGFDIKNPPSIGAQVFNYYVKTSQNMGPNPRHNYLGLVLFGYAGSMLFSFIVGAFIGFTRCKDIKKINFISLFLKIYFIIMAPIALTDATLLIYNIFNFLLVFLPVFLISYFIAKSIRKDKIYEN